MSELLDQLLTPHQRAQANAADAALSATINHATGLALAHYADVQRMPYRCGMTGKTIHVSMAQAQAAYDGMAEPDADDGPSEIECRIEAEDELARQPEGVADWLAKACTGAGLIALPADTHGASIPQLVAMLFSGTDAQALQARAALRDLLRAEFADVIDSRTVELMGSAA
jgi:hypothetical protein